MSRVLVLAALLAVVVPSSVSCVKAIPILTEIASVLINAQTEAERVDVYVQEYFRATGADEATRAEYAKIRDSLLLGLDAARSATEGAADLSQEQYASAFASFNQAWHKLEAFLQKTGALKGSALSASEGQAIEMPKPLALKFEAK